LDYYPSAILVGQIIGFRSLPAFAYFVLRPAAMYRYPSVSSRAAAIRPILAAGHLLVALFFVG